MNNINIENLKIKKPSVCVGPCFYSEEPNKDVTIAPEEEAKFINNVNTVALNKIIEEIEKEITNPDAWIPFEEAMDEIRRDILNE